MSTLGLVLREIRHRNMNFLLGVLAVAAAGASLAGAMTRLEAHRVGTERILAEREAATSERLAKLNDDVRKITLIQQFNIVILHKDQDLNAFLAKHEARTMPESFVETLAQSDITAINHLEPSLTEMIDWPEQNNSALILTGVRGEVPLRLLDAKKPFNQPVPKGSAVMGAVSAQVAGVKAGGSVTILGRTFKVAKVHEARGNSDDTTVWIHLSEAQELLKKPGQINAMKALNCGCTTAELDLIPGKIQAVLPGAKAILEKQKAVNRTASLERAERETKEAMQAEKDGRARLGRELESAAALVVPLVAVASALWLAVLAFLNVRARREEIGILRAIGVRSGKILAMFMLRALALGLLGGALGYAAGFLSGWWWGQSADVAGALDYRSVFSAPCAALVLGGGPLLAALASWLPALSASMRDPAEMLRLE